MAEPITSGEDSSDDGHRQAEAVRADQTTTPAPGPERSHTAAVAVGPDESDAPNEDATDQRDRAPGAPDVVPEAAGEAPTRSVPAAPRAQQPLPTTHEGSAPSPPRKKGNRVVATAWVLLAAGLFEVVFFAANALVALVFGGAPAVVPQVQSIAGTSLAWLPVLLFFLLFELTVLLFNRAGRVAYVLASLIVGAVVYVLTVLLFSVLVRHTLGDANTLAQTFLNWEFILVGLVAREVMLWTGLAIGSRGIRVRRRNREARTNYEQEVADVRD